MPDAVTVDTPLHDTPTSLYYMYLVTQSADKLALVVEATSPEQATEIANEAAIHIGLLDEEELEEDDPETFFREPVLVEAMRGTPGVRMHED